MDGRARKKRKGSSWVLDFWVWLFLLVFSLTPLAAVLANAREIHVSTRSWTIAIMWPVAFWLFAGYAHARCSSKEMSYYKGLQKVAQSTSTRYPIFTVIPSLLFAFVASVGISLYNDVRRSSQKTPASFHRLVEKFHKNRMRQH